MVVSGPGVGQRGRVDLVAAVLVGVLAVQLGDPARAHRGQELAQQLVVVARRLRPAVGVARPVAHVGVGDLLARLGLGLLEQLRGGLVVGDQPEVAQSDQRLQEGVEDVQVRGERVLEVVDPAREPGRPDAQRRRHLEGGQRLAGDVEVVRLAEQVAGAAVGLDRGRLGHAADPGRRAAVEGEHVLPGPVVARAVDGKALHLVEQPPQRRLVAARLAAQAGAVDQVRLLEGGQRVELQSLAGEEDVQDLAALEADLVARRRVGQ